MTEEAYAAMTAAVREKPGLVRAIRIANDLITRAVYVLYFLLVIVLAVKLDPRVIRVVLTTGIAFGAVSVYRKKRNAPRPYELLRIRPLIPKNTRGNSFPSRHVFSVFVIAMAYLYILPPVGVILLVVGSLLAFIRVLGGVHFPRDVVAGAVIGVAAGLIGFYLIP